jgi:hypothetical protein
VKDAAEQLLAENPAFQGFFNGNAQGLSFTIDGKGNFFIRGAISIFSEVPIVPISDNKIECIKTAIAGMVMRNLNVINMKTQQLAITCSPPEEALLGEITHYAPGIPIKVYKVVVFSSPVIPDNAIIVNPKMRYAMNEFAVAEKGNVTALLKIPSGDE